MDRQLTFNTNTIDKHFRKLVNNPDYNKNKQVYKTYLVLRSIPRYNTSVLISTARNLTMLPDIFEKYPDYLLGLSTLYIKFAITIRLRQYDVCRYIPNIIRSYMLRSLLMELELTSGKYEEILEDNLLYLLEEYNYFNNGIIHYELLFKDEIDVYNMVYYTMKLFEKERSFNILYTIYDKYIKDSDLKELYLNTLPDSYSNKMRHGLYKFKIYIDKIKRYLHTFFDKNSY